MQNRFYIFISRVVGLSLFLLLLFAPVKLVGDWLVKNYSSQASMVRLMDHVLDHSEGKSILILGDSTMRMLHQMKEDVDADPEVANISLGGSVMSEWIFVLREVLKRKNSIKVVLVGFSDPCSRIETSISARGYLPFLVGWRDVLYFYREGLVSLSSATRLFLYSQFPILHSKDEVMTQLLSQVFPSTQSFMRNLILNQEIKFQDRTAPDFSFPVEKEYLDFQNFLALLRAKQIPVAFLLSPLRSDLRDPTYKTCAARFLTLCQKSQLLCKDFGAVLKDELFVSDGAHVSPPFIGSFRSLVDGVVKELSVGRL